MMSKIPKQIPWGRRLGEALGVGGIGEGLKIRILWGRNIKSKIGIFDEEVATMQRCAWTASASTDLALDASVTKYFGADVRP